MPSWWGGAREGMAEEGEGEKAEEVEVKFRLFDGSDIGPVRCDAAATTAAALLLPPGAAADLPSRGLISESRAWFSWLSIMAALRSRSFSFMM